MNAPRSIYADPVRTAVCRSHRARAARAARAELRREQVLSDGPPRHLDRTRRLHEALRAYRGGVTFRDDDSPLRRLAAETEAELSALEAWAEGEPRAHQTSGPVIRQALDFLRTFGRLTVCDFSSVPEEERELLVGILAMEHRWCYAAAGTTRDAFKAAAGRTGAR